jgi:hypothetical protein
MHSDEQYIKNSDLASTIIPEQKIWEKNTFSGQINVGKLRSKVNQGFFRNTVPMNAY